MLHFYTRYSSLASKKILITGGATGIGRELVIAFRQQGSEVNFLDIDEENGSTLARETGAHFHYCDLRDVAALRATISGICRAGVDVLINNAARDDRHALEDVSPEYWRERLAVNLDHQFFASQAVAGVMKKQRRGVILLTSSTSFRNGRPGMIGYTTSKAAIIGLNNTLARELGEYGIRVNCLLPGAISTPRQEALWRGSQAETEILAKQAIPVLLQARDVAAMALFLASDDARGCTAAEFVIDAGIR